MSEQSLQTQIDSIRRELHDVDSREWNHHHDHAELIGYLKGQVSTLEKKVADLEAQRSRQHKPKNL